MDRASCEEPETTSRVAHSSPTDFVACEVAVGAVAELKLTTAPNHSSLTLQTNYSQWHCLHRHQLGVLSAAEARLQLSF